MQRQRGKPQPKGAGGERRRHNGKVWTHLAQPGFASRLTLAYVGAFAVKESCYTNAMDEDHAKQYETRECYVSGLVTASTGKAAPGAMRERRDARWMRVFEKKTTILDRVSTSLR